MSAARPPRALLMSALLPLLASTTLCLTSPQAHAATVTIAEDGFDRTVPTGLGSAPTGGAWTISAGSTTVSTANSMASFDGRSGQVLDASLRQAVAADVNLTETVVLPQVQADSFAMVGLSARVHAATGKGYRAWFNLNGNGRVDLHVNRLAASGDTQIGSGSSVAGLVKAGQRIRLRMVVTGSSPVTIKTTAWIDGRSEPAAQFIATDAAAERVTGKGYVGTALVGGQQATPVTVQHFTVTAETDAAPTPTPTPTQPAPAQPAPAPVVAPPAPAPAPAPDPAPAAAQGSLPVGQASYPVPAGAIYVSTSGNDANPGTQAAPKASLAAAIASAPAGGTVVVRGGTYHQGEVSIFKPLTVQNQPGEAVWFDGSSRVDGWQQQGSVWRAAWSQQWDHSASFTTGGHDNQFLDPAHPMAAWPDQVFVDGQQLEQVDLAKGPQAGQFAVDQANKQLVLGSNPSGHEVRASDRDRVFTVGSPDVTLRGFGVRRYANAIPRMGVLYLARQRDLVENVVIEDVATLGISMFSDGRNGAGSINRVTIRRAGLCAIDANTFDGGKVTNSVITQTNTEGFTPFPATAGVKVTRSKNVTLDNNLLVDNPNATGLWTDESVIGATVTRNRITNRNSDGFAGIQLELTSNAVVADNVISGNVRGIYLFDSNQLRVVNNTVSDSTIGDISVDQDFRRQANPGHTGHDPRNPVPDPSNTWVSGDITLNNNLFGTENRASHFQLYVLDKDRALAAGQMVTTATGNAFEAKDASSPTLIGWGKLDATVAQYTDPARWSSDVGRGWTNQAYPSGTPVAEAQKLANTMTHGAALDADIASRIGQSAGSRHIGAFQQI